MNKKGFTLIELLAVIVILAIIALITAPIILGVIENARKDSAKDKAWGTINAVELAYTQDQIKDSSYQIGDPVTFNDKKASVGTTEVKASGELPESGTVTIRNDGSIIAQNLKFDSYTCSTVKSETDNTIDPNNMVCVKGDFQVIANGVVYRYTKDKTYAFYHECFKTIKRDIKGINVTTDYSTLGKNYFLKHTIKDGNIISSDVCFIKDGQMYCLNPYQSMKLKLFEIFGERNCHTTCDTGVNVCVDDCGNNDVRVNLNPGGVFVYDKTGEACEIGLTDYPEGYDGSYECNDTDGGYEEKCGINVKGVWGTHFEYFK